MKVVPPHSNPAIRVRPATAATKPSVSHEGSTTASVLLRAFAAHGVRAAFGIPGGAIGPVYDALAVVPEIDFVATRHESIAMFAALGHARVTGTPALVLVTAGPGVTNCLTGIAAAQLEQLPVIVLGGEVPTAAPGRGGFQDGTPAGIDVVAMLRAVTRSSSTVLAPAMAAGAAERAWCVAAQVPQGPVFLSVPFDVACASSVPVPMALSRNVLAPPDANACAAAARYLASAAKPLLVLGNGARAAAGEALHLAERLSLPVAVTGHAKGAFPERHPLYLGIIGNAGHPSAADYVSNCPDVVCIVGSRVGDFATNGWRLDLSGAIATIQIDRDPLLVGRNARVTLGIVADAAAALESIAAALPADSAIRSAPNVRRVVQQPNHCVQSGLLQPHVVLASLAEAFPDATWCSDIGEHMGFAQHYLTVDRPDQFHCMSGLASMGSGLGAAIGIKHARPETTVIALVGDGGFNMHASDVLTCAERGIGVIFAVFNDGRWNMVEHGFRAVFRRRPAHLPERVADLAAVARGYGAVAEVIDRADQLDALRLRALAGDRPVVLDIRIDPAATLSADSRSAGLRTAGRTHVS